MSVDSVPQAPVLLGSLLDLLPRGFGVFKIWSFGFRVFEGWVSGLGFTV